MRAEKIDANPIANVGAPGAMFLHVLFLDCCHKTWYSTTSLFKNTQNNKQQSTCFLYNVYIYILRKEGVISLSAKSQRIPLAIGVSVEMT
jgi:hypothetical protein